MLVSFTTLHVEACGFYHSVKAHFQFLLSAHLKLSEMFVLSVGKSGGEFKNRHTRGGLALRMVCGSIPGSSSPHVEVSFSKTLNPPPVHPLGVWMLSSAIKKYSVSPLK